MMLLYMYTFLFILMFLSPSLVLITPFVRRNYWLVALFWFLPFIATLFLWRGVKYGHDDALVMIGALVASSSTFALALSAVLIGLRLSGRLVHLSRTKEFVILFVASCCVFFIFGALIEFGIWNV